MRPPAEPVSVLRACSSGTRMDKNALINCLKKALTTCTDWPGQTDQCGRSTESYSRLNSAIVN